MSKSEAADRGGAPTVAGVFVVSLLPALNWTVFGTSTIYLFNVDEFEAGYATLLPIYLGLGVCLAAVLTALGMSLKPIFRKHYVCLLFGLGALLWLQGAFLMHDYGVLDGRGIDWGAFRFPVWLDLFLWGGILAVAVVFADRVFRIAVFGAVLFILLQGVILSTVLMGHHEDVWARELRESAGPPQEIFSYSSSVNIVHVVLDNFQTDVFIDLVGEKNLKDEFDGFVLFRENTAVAPHTSLAVPAIFSGHIYDGSVSPDAYYRRSMEQGFHNALVDRGYTVNLIPLMSMRQGSYSHYYRPPKVYEGTAFDRIRKDAVKLLDVALFRQSPHILRRWIYNRNNWRLTMWLIDPETVTSIQQRRFFADYIENLYVREGAPAYHFIHLWPPHPPFTTSRSGRYAGEVLPNTRENYMNEARPITALFVELLHKMKAEGVYDNSLILLHSDHGGGFEPEFMPRRLLGLLAVKPTGSRGPMRVSDAPTSAADVAETIMKEVGISEFEFPGKSVLSIEDDEKRLRHFVYLGGEGTNTVHRIQIEGSAFSPDSYSQPEAIDISIEPDTYGYGDLVNMGLSGTGSRYLRDGWASPADRHVWSNDGKATLLLTVDPPSTNLTLVIDLIPHVHPENLPRQRVEVLINGREAAGWVWEEKRRQRLELEIPRAWIDAPELLIAFVMPDAASPADLGTGGDRRQLGIALINFQLRETTN